MVGGVYQVHMNGTLDQTDKETFLDVDEYRGHDWCVQIMWPKCEGLETRIYV